NRLRALLTSFGSPAERVRWLDDPTFAAPARQTVRAGRPGFGIASGPSAPAPNTGEQTVTTARQNVADGAIANFGRVQTVDVGVPFVPKDPLPENKYWLLARETHEFIRRHMLLGPRSSDPSPHNDPIYLDDAYK